METIALKLLKMQIREVWRAVASLKWKRHTIRTGRWEDNV